MEFPLKLRNSVERQIKFPLNLKKIVYRQIKFSLNLKKFINRQIKFPPNMPILTSAKLNSRQNFFWYIIIAVFLFSTSFFKNILSFIHSIKEFINNQNSIILIFFCFL